jgi:hypothetical protein
VQFSSSALLICFCDICTINKGAIELSEQQTTSNTKLNHHSGKAKAITKKAQPQQKRTKLLSITSTKLKTHHETPKTPNLLYPKPKKATAKLT